MTTFTSNELDELFSSDKPVLQGDICEFGSAHPAYPNHRFGVIITADCDLANKSAYQPAAYLRVVPLLTYVEDVWGPEQLARVVQRCSSEVCSEVNILRRAIDVGCLPLTESHLR